jgi:hypothetical protein
MISSALEWGYPGLGGWRTATIANGVSTQARTLAGLLGELVTDMVQAATLNRQIGEPLEQLINVYQSCAATNWDGEGAASIGEDAFRDACDLLMLLPTSIDAPTISPEPTGGIAFEWYQSPSHILVLSVDGSRSIQYAGMFGIGNECHGRMNFTGSLPKMAQQLLESFRGN